MEVGDLVLIKNCDNRFLNGKTGTVVLNVESPPPVYGLCILIQGCVYGFKEDEVEIINETSKTKESQYVLH